jgi:polyhydroxyalkanoate synthesis regulator phasin
VRPVEVVRKGPPRSNKVRVRWLDGEYEGLEEWVPQLRLVAPWEEAKALLEDERRSEAAMKASEDTYRTVPWLAVQMVFWAVPLEADSVGIGYRAAERELLVIRDLEEIAPRMGLRAEELLAQPHAYVDRLGNYKAPWGVALRVAKHCCKRFSQDVLRYVKREEDELREQIATGRYVSRFSDREFGIDRSYAEESLREQEPIFALIRGWCGQEAVEEFDQVAALREEVDRLRAMVEDIARWLRFSGHPVKAALVLKQLDRQSTDSGPP